MLFATALTLFLVPSLYIVIKSLESYLRDKDDHDRHNNGRGAKSDLDPVQPQTQPELATNYNIEADRIN